MNSSGKKNSISVAQFSPRRHRVLPLYLLFSEPPVYGSEEARWTRGYEFDSRTANTAILNASRLNRVSRRRCGHPCSRDSSRHKPAFGMTIKEAASVTRGEKVSRECWFALFRRLIF